MTPLTLIGGGGHALSLLEMMPENIAVCGYVDNHQAEGMPVTWLGTDDAFLSDNHDCPVHISLVWGADGDMSLRRKLIEKYRSHKTLTLVASTAVVSKHSQIGHGCAVMHRTVINGATIGDYSIVNTGAIIEHGVKLGENVFIGPGAVICGNAVIGDDCIIGAGAIVKNGISIAPHSIVGLGAAVVSDITEPGIYTGVPAKAHKKK